MDCYSWDYSGMESIKTRKQAKKGMRESRETGDVSGEGDPWMVADSCEPQPSDQNGMWKEHLGRCQKQLRWS